MIEAEMQRVADCHLRYQRQIREGLAESRKSLERTVAILQELKKQRQRMSWEINVAFLLVGMALGVSVGRLLS